MDAADWIYLNGHFFVTFAALVFVYLRRNRSFYFVRNMLMVAMAIALVGYWLYPTAPPRLMPEWGFTDSISQFIVGSTGHVDDGPGKAFLNFYAAVPSMHVCFALMIGVSLARLVSWRPGRIAWSLYPLLVTWVVVATGNHFLTDVFLGALTAAAAACVAKRLLARARPDVWAFGRRRRRHEAEIRDASRVAGTEFTVQGTNDGRADQADPQARRSPPTRAPRTGPTTQDLMRERLIESRLTPNAISLTGFVLNLARPRWSLERLFFLAGVAFIVGSVMDTLDGRYSPHVRQGHAVRRLPGLDARPARGGDRADRRRRLLRHAATTSRGRRRGGGGAVLADGLLHAGPGRGARRRVQGRPGHPAGPRGDPVGRPGVRQGRLAGSLRAARAGRLRARRR